MNQFKKTLGGYAPNRNPEFDSVIPPPPSQDELRVSRPPRGTRTPSVGANTPGFENLPEKAPGWMKRARRLVIALETAIENQTASPSEMAALERAFSAYEMGGASDEIIYRVAHLCERAHQAIRERFKGTAQEAYSNCAQVLHAGLPRIVRGHVTHEELVLIVKEMRSEADAWVAVVNASSRILSWDEKARRQAALAIRGAIDAHHS